MWRLWKSVTKSLRYNVASPATSVISNNTIPPCSPLQEESLQTLNPVYNAPIDFGSARHHQQQSDGENRKQNTSKFKCEYCPEQAMFLEICGLSSAVALGWQFSQPIQNKIEKVVKERKPCLLKTFLSLALAQPVLITGTRLSINSQQGNKSLTNSNKAENVVEESSSIPALNLLISEENHAAESQCLKEQEQSKDISQTMSSILEAIENSENLRLAEWQNSVGVQLLSAAETGEISCYDYLLNETTTLANRSSIYKREAFSCFKDSFALGSVKGAFNMGICYQQGLGTSIDLNKAVKCFEEAAKNGHAAAQYNLGLLHLNGQLEVNDVPKAISLIRQAARQGLEQAWSCLVSVLHTGSVVDLGGSTSSLAAVSNDISEGLRVATQKLCFRKVHSEPYSLSSSLGDFTEESENPSFNYTEDSVSFY